MARMRVHEIAKEFNVNNKDLIDRLLKLGIQVKNHMSTLSDTAVQRIRQHFVEAAAEEVEQKRIGRAVIRRRRRNPLEEAPPETAEVPSEVMTETHPSSEVLEVPSPEPVTESESEPVRESEMVQHEETAPAPEEEKESFEEEVQEQPAAPAVAVSPPAPFSEVRPNGEVELPEQEVVTEASSAQQTIEKKIQEGDRMSAEAAEPVSVEVEAPLGKREKPARPMPVHETVHSVKKEQPATRESAIEAVEGSPTSPETGVAEERRDEPKVGTKSAATTEARTAEPAPALVPGEKVSSAEGEEPPAAVQEEGDAGEDKPKKKAKKRRRKKAHKDEPARIIKLPEIIPEEPEEEPEVLAQVPPRLQVVVEEVETKEAARKKRVRVEEPEKEAAAGRKRRGGGGAGAGVGRKEVFVREDLYTKRELAAQADRERGKGKDRDRDRDRMHVLKEIPKPEPEPIKIGKKKVKIDEAITVANLAKQMGIKASEIIKKLLTLGLPANLNQAIDFDSAALVASDFDFEVEKVGFEEDEIILEQEDHPEEMVLRPPVVTVMGHVDHGKTSLLDAIRHTNVIGGEAGGITQHIGAYDVKLEKGEVVFLDTPGHEAFTAMRARGAKVTDIVILVVAADDGVMQQTIEAINHSKAAQVPIIVAINKVDKPGANIDKVKRELSEQGLLPEAWGGNVTMVEVSAKKKMGIEDLLEMVLLQAELMELKASPKKSARGRVIEAKLDRGRGPVATILVQEGTLKPGDAYVCGVQHGRVRNMFNDRGQKIEAAGPSMPVEVLGLSGVPNAGDDFAVVADEKQAKVVGEHRLLKQREKELSRTSKITLERLYEQIQEGEIKELNVVIKTDVQGSMEAISESLQKLSTPEVKVSLIHCATGAITETDIMLASASNAIVIGFNVRSDGKVQELADQEHVDVRYYDIIYQLMNDIKDAMVGMLEPEYKENVIGRATVIQIFHVPKIGTIAGSHVNDGRLERNAKVRVLRDGVVIYDGKITSLRRFKDDAKEVKAGFECGVSVENFNDIKLDDILEAYELQEIKATLSDLEAGRDKKDNKD